jgi:RNA polymerase sigma-70 factor (ECF subfamily)
MELGPLNRTAAGARGGSDAGSIQSDSVADEFERLTLPLVGEIARFAQSLTRDRPKADDLVQETYLRALNGWHTFRPDADPKRWLMAICHHTFLRTARREARYVDAIGDDPELDSLATAIAHHEANRAGVLEAFERIDLRAAIHHALGQLPSHLRGCVVLVDVEDHSYETAAAILGVAVGTVRSRLFRGRRILQDLLFEYARDAGFACDRSPERNQVASTVIPKDTVAAQVAPPTAPRAASPPSRSTLT